MELTLWILTGAVIGWVAYSRFGYNEERGRNVSMILGVVGALIGAKGLAPMFFTMPAGDLSTAALAFAAVAATGALALGNLVSERWGL